MPACLHAGFFIAPVAPATEQIYFLQLTYKLIMIVFFFFFIIINYEVISMMLFTVYDKKAKLAGPLFEAQTLDVAKRMVISSLAPTSALVQYPMDFEIVIVGEFDRNECELMPSDDIARCPVAVLISDHLRGYCLDGTFPRERSVDEHEKQTS